MTKRTHDELSPAGSTGPADDSKKDPSHSASNQEQYRPEKLCEKEQLVGISAYLSDLSGFSAIFKMRYSDFLVNELGVDGSIVRFEPDKSADEQTKTRKESVDLVAQEQKTCAAELEERIGVQALANLHDILRSTTLESVETRVFEREERAPIHKLIRQLFGGKLSSETCENGAIKVSKRGSGSNRRGIKSQEFDGFYDKESSQNVPEYTRFVLYKENKDTMDALNHISRVLKVNVKEFSYAGTKDRRAKTVQLVTAHKIPKHRLLGATKIINGVDICNFTEAKDKLALGDLKGNLFTIVLREVIGDRSNIDTALASLKQNGFINYFGMQRFGTQEVGTHKIGLSVLLGDFEKAVSLILHENCSKDDDKATVEARGLWRTDPEKSLSLFPRRFAAERSILSYLIKKPNRYVDSFSQIPRNLRTMYVHAYQSFIWNQVVSFRIHKFGTKVLVGDLVLIEEKTVKIIETDDECSLYSITQIVLPLPGKSIMYPRNEIGNLYQTLLQKDSLTLNHFESAHLKEYCLHGDYRRIIEIPKDMNWTFSYYDDHEVPLCLSDYDKEVRKLQLPKLLEFGKHLALVVSFQLEASSYATMALREVMKKGLSSE